MAAKYFLMILGCKILDIELNIKHESLEAWNHYKNCFTDDFYKNYDNFIGLNKTRVIFKKNKEANKLMNNIVYGIIGLLDTKMIVNEGMLITCFEFCNLMALQIENNNNNKKEKKKENNLLLIDNLINTLQNLIEGCLATKNSRNFLYFKQFILNNNIWFCKYNNNILFNLILDVVNKQLYKQKEYIWDNIQNEQKTDSATWDKLCNFGREEFSFFACF